MLCQEQSHRVPQPSNYKIAPYRPYSKTILVTLPAMQFEQFAPLFNYKSYRCADSQSLTWADSLSWRGVAAKRQTVFSRKISRTYTLGKSFQHIS